METRSPLPTGTVTSRLRLHSHAQCTAVAAIAVEALRQDSGRLRLTYEVIGRIDGLRLAPLDGPQRRDGLWRTTCFEAFVRATTGTAYYELNFAPSSAWAAYRFQAYREGMQVAQDVSPPRIEPRVARDRFALHASLAIGGLPRHEPWQLGIAAVIEELDGGMSYWALAHPPGKPDFHHADGFTATLPPVLGTTSSK